MKVAVEEGQSMVKQLQTELKDREQELAKVTRESTA